MNSESNEPCAKVIIDAFRTAVRKYATLYDPFPAKQREFYQQPCLSDLDILMDYDRRYESSESESRAALTEFFGVIPHDNISSLISGDKVVLRQVSH